MKVKWLCGFLSVLLLLLSVGCSPLEEPTSNSENSSNVQSVAEIPKNITIPDIKSSDTVMPLFFDISLFDEENYSQVYLGKKFVIKMRYGTDVLTVPTTIEKMSEKGWNLFSETYTPNSMIKAGETLQIPLTNGNVKRLTASFYNAETTSILLKDCPIVRLKVEQNALITGAYEWDSFWVNGVHNQSAITDIIEYLGTPSHFYRVSENEYYLDYFQTKHDRRSKITVWIRPQDDCVTAVEISNYQ